MTKLTTEPVRMKRINYLQLHRSVKKRSLTS